MIQMPLIVGNDSTPSELYRIYCILPTEEMPDDQTVNGTRCLQWNIGCKSARNDQGLRAIAAMTDTLEDGCDVLVHCVAGRHRSALAAAFFLVWDSFVGNGPLECIICCTRDLSNSMRTKPNECVKTIQKWS